MELSLPDLPDVFRSRTDGYCFQPAVGITYVVVRHLLHSHLSFMESRDTRQDVNVLHSPVPLLLEYLYSRVTHSDFVGIGRVVCVFVGVRVWTIWESSDKWEVWRDGLRVRSRISRALQALHLSRLRNAVVLFRKRFHPYSTNDVGSSQELAGRRDGIVGGGV